MINEEHNHLANSGIADYLSKNPFLCALGPPIPYVELAGHLACNPLSGFSLAGLSMMQREDLLAFRERHFIPTTSSLNIIATLQTMLRENYIQRNPMDPEVRKRVMEIAGYSGQEISALPWFPTNAAGAIVKGITGTGKSTIWKRYLRSIPQVCRYGPGDIPGFHLLTQIVWIKVDMSADGSRGGFLLSILAEVDRLVGTDYHHQYIRAKITIEKLMVKVGIVLSSHFVGMLVIEEIQPENFSCNPHMKEFVTFFLRLLNFGIPVVMIGNPLGFEALPSSSQVTRRLTMGGSFELHPYETVEEFDLKNSYLPGIWDFDVMPTPTLLCDTLRKKFYEYSGGIPDFVFRLRVESQRIALRFGRNSVVPEDMDRAFHGETFRENHDLILGFANKDIHRLSKCADIPIEYYQRRWEQTTERDRDLQAGKAQSGADKVVVSADATKKISDNPKAAQFKGALTREANREKKVSNLKATLPRSDARNGGARDALMENMEQLRKMLPG